MSSEEGLMAGAGAGFCMARKAKIELTSASYDASAIVLPLAARRQAAIHLAYWASCYNKARRMCPTVVFDQIRKSETYGIAPDPHLGHAIRAGNFQPDTKFVLRQIDIRSDFATS